MLGGLQIWLGETMLPRLRTGKTAALLAYLAYYSGTPHRRERLMGQIWPDAAEAAGRVSLRSALASLRRQLEPPGTPVGALFVVSRDSIGLNSANICTDVAAMEAALESAHGFDTLTEQIPLLMRAVELYRGELLPGCFEEWVLTERERLAQLAIDVLFHLVLALEQAGESRQAILYALRAVSLYPLHEEAVHALMRLYAATGQNSQALRQYRLLTERIQARLGHGPSAALQTYVEQLRK